jgi:hypothetical protein
MSQENAISKVKEQMKASILAEVQERHDWVSKQKRKAWVEQDVLTKDEIAEITKKQEQWEALCEQGEEEGWLDWTNDYAGSHLYAVNASSLRHPTRTCNIEEDDFVYKNRVENLERKIAREAATLFVSRWNEIANN